MTLPLPRRALPPSSPAHNLQVWQPWYDSIIDWFIANPGGKIRECAEALNKTPSWIGQLMRADFFRARFDERRKAYSEGLDNAIGQRLNEVALASLDALLGRLSKTNVVAMKTPDLLKVVDSTLASLGYGEKPSAAPGTAVNVAITVSQDGLAKARENLRFVEATRFQSPSGPEPVGDRARAITYQVPEGDED